MHIIKNFGLNMANLYAPSASVHILAAQTRPDVLEALRGLRVMLCTGVALEPEIQALAYELRIPIRVTRNISLLFSVLT
jgi:hypothetical protein